MLKPRVVDGVTYCPKCGGTDFRERTSKVYALSSNSDGKLVFAEEGEWTGDETYWCAARDCGQELDAIDLEVDWE